MRIVFAGSVVRTHTLRIKRQFVIDASMAAVSSPSVLIPFRLHRFANVEFVVSAAVPSVQLRKLRQAFCTPAGSYPRTVGMVIRVPGIRSDDIRIGVKLLIAPKAELVARQPTESRQFQSTTPKCTTRQPPQTNREVRNTVLLCRIDRCPPVRLLV